MARAGQNSKSSLQAIIGVTINSEENDLLNGSKRPAMVPRYFLFVQLLRKP